MKSVLFVVLLVGLIAMVPAAENGVTCACPRIYSPLCGSDGATYSNKCLFECEQAKKSDLKIAHEGTC